MPLGLIGESFSISGTWRIEQSVLNEKGIEILFVHFVSPCRVHCKAEEGSLELVI